ncbi:hypothetical protein FPV67DRAFT_1672199 [Lyophyllum atratum]|nr:hypothetical protein FPV67DRAFT_1672199 [Lyophyllum atratum]
MGFTSFRMGHLHKPKSQKITPRAATPNPSCATGGFYKAPSNGATIDSLQPLSIEWDTTCLDTQKVDIHLLAPWFNGPNTEMTVWRNIPNANGKTTVNIMPKWWNATSSVNVQLTIVPANSPPGMTTLPAGPVITATYTPPADGHIPASADTSKPDSPNNPITESSSGTTKSLSGGKTAAAVLLPLLIVALALFLYFRHQRRKASTKSKRFSQAIDKRMSTISTDWKSMSAAGAQAAIRSSIAVNRDSSAFAFGAIRPMSTVGAEMEGQDGSGQQMKQVRTGTGVGLRNPNAAALAAERASRVSRVSFAADTRQSRVSFADSRPSGESRRTRAFHSAYVPPLPTRADVVSAVSEYPDSELEKEVKKGKTGSPTLSPRQATGPLTLTPEDIRARIQGRGAMTAEAKRAQEEEYDEVMPALSMMRTGLEPTTPSATTTSFSIPLPAPSQLSTTDEYLFTPLPTPPQPTHPSPISPSYTPTSFTGATYAPTLPSPINTSAPFTPSAYAYNQAQSQPPTPATPSMALSPDDMLRAYAERKAAAAAASEGAPSSYAQSSPRVKGRKLSLRQSFGIKGLGGGGKLGGERVGSPALDKGAISYPMPAPSSSSSAQGGMAGVGARSAGMAGVGVGAGAGMGMGGGAQYAIGEDEDEDVDYESAYVV